MPKNNSKIFIGSSTEAKEIALAIQHELKDFVDVDVWSQGMFRAGSIPLEVLVQALEGFDFAVFIFSPDDLIKMREVSFSSVRDNVVFELGLFIGKLGRTRCIFVSPYGQDLHVPSDLKGVLPATYNPNEVNIQKSVAGACFEIKKMVREIGPIHSQSSILFDGPKQNIQAYFQGVEGRDYKDGKAVSERGRGTLSFDNKEGCLVVSRSNTEGKFEIQLRPKGPKRPSFEKRYTPPPRLIRISCEAKVERGEHTLRFLLKDEEGDRWLGREKKVVSPGDWTRLESFLWVDSTKDVLFRIDDIAAHAPSSIFIRNLSISEQSS